MNTTQQLVQEAKKVLKVDSDYALAKQMRWSRQAVSNYQLGKRHLDVDACFDLADLLHRDLATIIAAVEAERATEPEAREAWNQRLKRLGGVAAMWVVFTVTSALPAPAEALSAAMQHSGISAPHNPDLTVFRSGKAGLRFAPRLRQRLAVLESRRAVTYLLSGACSPRTAVQTPGLHSVAYRLNAKTYGEHALAGPTCEGPTIKKGDDVMTPFAGGCSCGAIRYECTARPLFSWNCHCRDCQRASGAAYCPVMYVPKTALTITGPAARYASLHAESGRLVSRGLCGDCGSNLFILADLVPDLQGLWAGSLDDPDIFSPQINVWTRSAPVWSTPDPTLQSLDTAPDEAQFRALLRQASGH